MKLHNPKDKEKILEVSSKHVLYIPCPAWAPGLETDTSFIEEICQAGGFVGIILLGGYLEETSNLAPSMTDEDAVLQKGERKCLCVFSHSLGRTETRIHSTAS